MHNYLNIGIRIPACPTRFEYMLACSHAYVHSFAVRDHDPLSSRCNCGLWAHRFCRVLFFFQSSTMASSNVKTENTKICFEVRLYIGEQIKIYSFSELRFYKFNQINLTLNKAYVWKQNSQSHYVICLFHNRVWFDLFDLLPPLYHKQATTWSSLFFT